MPKKDKAERWLKRPPISGMSIEEMQKRVADGIANRRKTGELPSKDLKILKTQPSGPTLTQKQRRVMVHATELAIYSLANNEREDYCGAVKAINAVRRQVGMSTKFMREILEGVAEQAAELMGEDFTMIDHLARHWLADYFTPSGKLISITKGKGNGNTEDKTQN